MSREGRGGETRRGGLKETERGAVEENSAVSVCQPGSRAEQCDRGGEGEQDLGSAANRGCRDELQHKTEEERVKTLWEDSLQGEKKKSDLRTTPRLNSSLLALNLHLHFGPLLMVGIRSWDGEHQMQRAG